MFNLYLQLTYLYLVILMNLGLRHYIQCTAFLHREIAY